MKIASPTCLKLTLRELQIGSTLSLGECLQMEYRFVHRIIKHNDFHEGSFLEYKIVLKKTEKTRNNMGIVSGLIVGVKAALVRKDNKPKWNPSRIEDVTEQSISYFFKPFSNSDELPM